MALGDLDHLQCSSSLEGPIEAVPCILAGDAFKQQLSKLTYGPVCLLVGANAEEGDNLDDDDDK